MDTHLRTNHHTQKSGQDIFRTPCAHETWPPAFTPSPDCATADFKTIFARNRKGTGAVAVPEAGS
ncbi:hypothetical protein BN1708_002098 [Verticillium longisporum]|uniref:Uncharacterized protein n=1 Tax=Verticillium longisporum TaxID=100787 RepID=A0A0G4KH38_VERLO|nr:hypothetical protein BN1708_002098 [Verticillium longisporum]